VRRRRRMPDELAKDAGLTAEQEMCRVLKSILDRLMSEMPVERSEQSVWFLTEHKLAVVATSS